MKRPVRFAFSIVSLLLLISGSIPFAQQIVEVDLDGNIGNGPDTIDLFLGDQFDAGIWWIGGEQLNSVGSYVCGEDAVFEYVGVDYPPSCMTHSPPEFPLPDCTYLASTDFCFSCYAQPFEHATITYRAAGESPLSRLFIDTQESAILTCNFSTVFADSAVDAFVRIAPPTSTGRSSWGSVKQLFR